MTITVFTPTYNRADLLETLYKSLCSQEFKDFEWLIVDDGSTDNTGDVIRKFKNDNIIDIKYFKTENGGKHRAINYGVKKASGELFYIVDSDDKLPKNSLSLVNEHYQVIKDNPDFGGVCGLKAYFDGTLLPGEKEFGIIEKTLKEYFYYSSKSEGSDLLEIVPKTDILNGFPFPEFEGEKFCAESAIWIPIGEKYKFRIFDKVIYLCEFQETGLSANSLRSRMKYPNSAMYIYRIMLGCRLPLKTKIKSAANYWRFYFCKSANRKIEIPLIYYPMSILGLLLHIRDKRLSRTRLKIGRER